MNRKPSYRSPLRSAAQEADPSFGSNAKRGREWGGGVRRPRETNQPTYQRKKIREGNTSAAVQIGCTKTIEALRSYGRWRTQESSALHYL